MNPSTADDIKCDKRGLRSDGLPVCRVVEHQTGLPIEECIVNDDACRYCLANFRQELGACQNVIASMSLTNLGRNKKLTPELVKYFQDCMGPVSAGVLIPEKKPCFWRDDATKRNVECKPCQAGSLSVVLVPVHACELHGECTERNTGTFPRVRACSTCVDHKERDNVAK